jgi:acetoacetate decarboxylase
LLCRYGKTAGGYFLNLQLSGPGAAMGMCSGREFSGLPKKVCERIVVERAGDCAQALIESKGKRIFDVALELGAYNDPRAEQFYVDAAPGRQSRGSCLLFQYERGFGDGHLTFPKMALSNYDSVTDYQTWERASIKSVKMEPSLDDPWAELLVVRPIGAAYSKNSNRVLGVSKLADFDGKEADNLISYLLSGRWDRSTISGGSQRYGQL